MDNKSKVRYSNLKPCQYGLPDELKFPIDNEDNIIKSAKFFSYCDVNKRPILASNINKMARLLKVKIPVHPYDTIYKYIDRVIVMIPSEERLEEEPQPKYIANINNFSFYRLVHFKIKSDDDLYRYVELVNESVKELDKANKLTDDSFLYRINGILYRKHEDYIHIKNFINNTKIGDDVLFDALLYDLTNTILCWYRDGKDIWKLLNGLLTTINLLNYHNNDAYVSQRILLSLCILRINLKYSEYNDFLQNENFIKQLENSKGRNSEDFIDEVFGSLTIEDLPLTVKIIERQREEIENGIDTIKKCIKVIEPQIPHLKYLLYDESTDILLYQSLSYLEKIFNRENTNVFNLKEILESKSLTFSLTNDDLFKLNYVADSDESVKCFYLTDNENNEVYFLVKGEQLYIVVKSLNERSGLFLLRISIDNEIIRFSDLHEISEEYPKVEHGDLTEGLTIDDNGEVKLSLRRINYMDEYVDIHSKMKKSIESSNWEEVKYLLACEFMLIDRIDSEDNSNKSYQEISTRQNLMVDFRSSLRALNENVANFNFTDYYQSCETLQNIVSLDTDSSKVGMLFRKIMIT